MKREAVKPPELLSGLRLDCLSQKRNMAAART